MESALDLDATLLNEGEREFVDQIREHGWFGTHIFDGDPAYSFTTGFHLHQPAEFILFSLDRTVTHNVFWDLYRDGAEGRAFPVGRPVDDVFAAAPAYFFNVADRYHRNYLGWTLWFFRKPSVPTVQIVWPDRAGLFPWQSGFDEKFRNSQPDLTETGWANEIRDWE